MLTSLVLVEFAYVKFKNSKGNVKAQKSEVAFFCDQLRKVSHKCSKLVTEHMFISNKYFN